MDASALTSPVTKSVTVPLPPDEAFTLFTTGMSRWWPLETHGIAADTRGGAVTAEAVTVEEGVGGRIVETMSDGTQGEWGRILAWDPPHRLAFSWNPTLEPRPTTRIEVSFTGAPEGTRVELVHSGWEALGDRGEAMREAYDGGWVHVLGRYASAA